MKVQNVKLVRIILFVSCLFVCCPANVSAETGSLITEFLNDKARVHYKKGNIENAVDGFSKVLILDPGNKMAHSYLKEYGFAGGVYIHPDTVASRRTAGIKGNHSLLKMLDDLEMYMDQKVINRNYYLSKKSDDLEILRNQKMKNKYESFQRRKAPRIKSIIQRDMHRTADRRMSSGNEDVIRKNKTIHILGNYADIREVQLNEALDAIEKKDLELLKEKAVVLARIDEVMIVEEVNDTYLEYLRLRKQEVDEQTDVIDELLLELDDMQNIGINSSTQYRRSLHKIRHEKEFF